MRFIHTLIILRSNLRLIDCINRPKQLVARAIENGLMGFAITDHETLAGAVEFNKLACEVKKEHPDFKIAIGNEIYLCADRSLGQKYYHFILIAKNKTGFRALRELSTRAWLNSYRDRGMERVVTTYDDLREIVGKYPGSLIASSACLGGQISSTILELIDAERAVNEEKRVAAHDKIVEFILFCKELFGEDFYLETAPGCSKDQIRVNNRMVSVAKAFGVKMVIGTDAHFLKSEDRYVHKAYLNSKDGEREVDEFYAYSYLQTEDEIKEHLKDSILDQYDTMVKNSEEIYSKIEDYDLFHNQQIPRVEVEEYPVRFGVVDSQKYPVLDSMFASEDKVERYWVNQCYDALVRKNLLNDRYLERLNEEARVKRVIGEKLETNMFMYPVTLQHYIDMFWERGSSVGAGRGSSCAGLNHYLLGITQLDPIVWNLPFFRYLNDERVELGCL